MRYAKWVALGVLALVLGGCTWTQNGLGPTTGPTPVPAPSPTPNPNERVATFIAKVVSPTKISVDGRASKASEYTWFFDDGTDPVTGGPEVAVYSHEYKEPNVYVVRLVVKWEDDDSGGGGGGGNGGGCCGPRPGPRKPGGEGGETTETTGSAYQVVSLLNDNGITPILIVWSVHGPTDFFYPWEQACFDLSESKGQDLVYWVEVVRVVSRDNPTPIPYDWDLPDDPNNPVVPPTPPPGVEYIRWTGERNCIYIPGPGGCSGETWTFRVTVRATDRFGRSTTITKFLYTGCCP